MKLLTVWEVTKSHQLLVQPAQLGGSVGDSLIATVQGALCVMTHSARCHGDHRDTVRRTKHMDYSSSCKGSCSDAASGTPIEYM